MTCVGPCCRPLVCLQGSLLGLFADNCENVWFVDYIADCCQSVNGGAGYCQRTGTSCAVLNRADAPNSTQRFVTAGVSSLNSVFICRCQLNVKICAQNHAILCILALYCSREVVHRHYFCILNSIGRPSSGLGVRIIVNISPNNLVI